MKLQQDVDKVFIKNFGYSPLNERLKDIQNEFFELMKWQDVPNLKEEAGDLMASLIQLHNENEWDVEDNVKATLDKIESRHLQYKSLGRKTKVAILGGAFDPITLGHIQSAQFVLNTSGEFDEVWIMPAYKHMAGKDMAGPGHRLNMCRLAAKVDKRIKIFAYEIENELAGETYNFFKRLKAEEEYSDKYNFSMIIGQDNANTFDTWVNFKELERMVRFVVIPRKGVERDPEVNWYLKEPHIFLNNETEIIEISSTKIKEGLKTVWKGFIRGLDPEVLKYIQTNKIYPEQ
jgi:nicotinate-nucleotide adenylyltransferase